MAVGDFLEKYEFSYLMEQALEMVPEGVDTREGSIIYDALAPACYQLAEHYMNIKNLVNDSFPSTAIGEYLDLKVQEQGLTRLPATRVTKIATFRNIEGNQMAVPIGSRFSSKGSDSVIYNVIRALSSGNFIIESETYGSAPNAYIGELLPVDNIADLGQSLILEIEVAGRDLETDDELRGRYFLALNEKPFGGNIAEYIQHCKSLEGVGNVMVFPVWNGGGTVGLQIVSPQNLPASTSTISLAQEYFDPLILSQKGTGIAPIGHKVTVATPKEFKINIEATISVGSGTGSVKESVKESIEEYLKEVRNSMGVYNDMYEYHLYIYVARILVSILQTPGIINASEVKINGETSDLFWQNTFLDSTIPVLGEVVLNENPLL